MYKISVIIPVYNSQDFLKKCLDSVLNQSLDNYEVIVIDDGSTDKSLEIIKSFSNKYSNLTYKSKINEGQAVARNLGIETAKGEYVCFVDSDDYIDKYMLEKLYKKAISEKADIVVCDFFEEYKNKTIPRKALYINAENIAKSYMVSMAGPCWKIIKTSLFKNNSIKFLENCIYEDLAIIPALALYTDKISYYNESLYHYIIREESTMQKKNYNKSMESIFDVINFVYDKFKDKNYQAELEFLYINHLLYAGCGRFLQYKNTEDMILKIRNIMKEKFPKWRENIYFKKQNKIYKVTCNIFYRYNKFEIAIYKLLRKMKNKGDLV